MRARIAILFFVVFAISSVGTLPANAEYQPTKKEIALKMPDVAVKAFSAFDTARKVQLKSKAKLNISVYKSPSVDNTGPEQTLKDLKAGVSFWTSVYAPNNSIPTLFLTDTDHDWLKQTLDKLGIPSQKTLANYDSQVESQHSHLIWAGSSSEEGKIFNFYAIGKDAPFWGKSLGFIPPHEWTHNVQQSLSDSSNLPCWFREGQAQYYGGAITATTLKQFAETRLSMLKFASGGAPDSFFSPPSYGWKKFLEIHDEKTPPQICGPDLTYGAGFAATEYLLSLKGHQGIVDFMKSSKTTPWKVSIEKIYKKPWPVLLTEISTYVDKAAHPAYIGKKKGSLPKNSEGLPSWYQNNSGNAETANQETGIQKQEIIDNYPPGVPAPGRTCPGNKGAKTNLGELNLICNDNEKWELVK